MRRSPALPPLLVAGLGRAGAAALEAALTENGSAGIFGWDSGTSSALVRTAKAWRTRGVPISLGGDGVNALARLGFDGTIIKSPGIDTDIPLLMRAREAGLSVIDELEFGWRRMTTPVVGVTGTNGKSTTCALVAAVLRTANRKCQVVGNTEFGPPLSAAARDNDVIVCEVSSFQLEACPTFLPEFAIFTNLTPEHLTRHGTMAAYGAIKSRMFVRDPSTGGCAVGTPPANVGFRLIREI